MTAERVRKHEKHGLEPYTPAGWMSPFGKMEEMFDEYFRRPFLSTRWPEITRMLPTFEPTPSVDIYEEGKNIIVKSDLPGMTKDDIEITLTEDNIIITGEKKKEEKTAKKDYYCVERSYGSFRRSIPLPVEVQTEKAKASFRDGVLELRIPKAAKEKKKGRKIKVE